MRVEWLFFRWLAVIAVFALAFAYCRSSRQEPPTTDSRYDTIPLIQGGKASGMPLAGIVVDPVRRDVSAVIGGPAEGDESKRFFIVWKGREGETYGTAFMEAANENVLCEVSPDGAVKTLQRFPAETAVNAPQPASPDAESALRSLLDGLPDVTNMRGR